MKPAAQPPRRDAAERAAGAGPAQALANSLDDAVKYTPSGGAIMLRVRRRASGEIEFSVTDTGPRLGVALVLSRPS